MPADQHRPISDLEADNIHCQHRLRLADLIVEVIVDTGDEHVALTAPMTCRLKVRSRASEAAQIEAWLSRRAIRSLRKLFEAIEEQIDGLGEAHNAGLREVR